MNFEREKKKKNFEVELDEIDFDIAKNETTKFTLNISPLHTRQFLEMMSEDFYKNLNLAEKEAIVKIIINMVTNMLNGLEFSQ